MRNRVLHHGRCGELFGSKPISLASIVTGFRPFFAEYLDALAVIRQAIHALRRQPRSAQAHVGLAGGILLGQCRWPRQARSGCVGPAQPEARGVRFQPQNIRQHKRSYSNAAIRHSVIHINTVGTADVRPFIYCRRKDHIGDDPTLIIGLGSEHRLAAAVEDLFGVALIQHNDTSRIPKMSLPLSNSVIYQHPAMSCQKWRGTASHLDLFPGLSGRKEPMMGMKDLVMGLKDTDVPSRPPATGQYEIQTLGCFI